MKLYTERQTKIITNSFRKVFANHDIGFLNKPAYQFLMSCSGFNDHLSLEGFRARFKSVKDFATAIKQTPIKGDLPDNIHSQCQEVYKDICEVAENYLLNLDGNNIGSKE